MEFSSYFSVQKFFDMLSIIPFSHLVMGKNCYVGNLKLAHLQHRKNIINIVFLLKIGPVEKG